MGCEKPAALGQSDRVRADPADLLDARSRHGNKVVADAQQGLALNGDPLHQQQVVVLGHRSSQTVLNGNDGRIHMSFRDPAENFCRECTGNDPGARLHLQRRLMAEGSRLSLNGYLHFCAHPQTIEMKVR